LPGNLPAHPVALPAGPAFVPGVGGVYLLPYRPVPGVVCLPVFIKENILAQPCPISIYPDRGSEHGRVCFPRSADRCRDGCHGRYPREGPLPRTPERGAGFCCVSPPGAGQTTPGKPGPGALRRYRRSFTAICRRVDGDLSLSGIPFSLFRRGGISAGSVLQSCFLPVQCT